MRPPPSPPVLPLLLLVLALLLLFTPFSAAAASGGERTTAAVVNEDGEIRIVEGQPVIQKLGTLQSLAVLHFLRSTEHDLVSTPFEDLDDAPPSLQELVECAASLSLFDAGEEGREEGREGGAVSMLLPRLVTVKQPVEKEPKEGEEEEEVTERRPRIEAESLALAVNATTYRGTSALWGVFDSLNSTLQQQEGGREGGREGVVRKNKHFHHYYLPKEAEESEKAPVVQAEWHTPASPACADVLDTAIRLQQGGQLGFFEIWPEQGPLGSVLKKGKEGKYHENGPRSCMGYAKRSFNEQGGLAVFSLALCADYTPMPGMVASGVIKNLGSDPLCAVTLRVYKLPMEEEEEEEAGEEGREGGREPSLLSEIRLEGYVAPYAFLVYQVQASPDFSERDRHAVALLGEYSLCTASRQPDPSLTRSWAPPPPPSPPSSPMFKEKGLDRKTMGA